MNPIRDNRLPICKPPDRRTREGRLRSQLDVQRHRPITSAGTSAFQAGSHLPNPEVTDPATVRRVRVRAGLQGSLHHVPDGRSREGRLRSQLDVQRPASGRPAKRRQVASMASSRSGLTIADTHSPLPTAALLLPPIIPCPHCSAEKLMSEPLHFCCGNGEIQLASNEYPPELCRLFLSQDEDAVHFRTYARLYNNLFAFSSLGGQIDCVREQGIYVFKLQGQIYHFVPSLLPSANNPKYLQLYFYDGEQEACTRSRCFPELRQDVIDILMSVTADNPYAKFFRSLKEVDLQEDTQIVINKHIVPDQRTYNAPTSDEVAVIWPDVGSSSTSEGPHIVVSGRSNESHRIMHFYGCYDPLAYPILFPGGECGWMQRLAKVSKPNVGYAANVSDVVSSCDVQQADSVGQLLADEAACAGRRNTKKEKFVSCREYYSYKIQNRPGNMIIRAGRCYQQYIVDMYVKVENTRLDFFRHNQETIRAELYQGLVDTLHSGECSAANVGRRVILPATYIGGPRDMKKRYLNAMALVQRFGKPDLFVTMTCNTNWPEIQRELAEKETPQNRPELVTRVFRAKLLALKKHIMEDKIFGEVAALIYVVEFQKRGLPHAHFLIILKLDFKIKCPADFDKYVSAEIPLQEQELLRSTVLKHMMHGPCGPLNPDCKCMLHTKTYGRCKYGYPKQFLPDTTNNVDGYPMYRRRDTGEFVKVRRCMLDNSWVIPHNPYLLILFDCHVNVEVCSTIQAVKYLYKYVYKGHDKISFNVVANSAVDVFDEITHFQSGRWVSPCEAAWRLYKFDLFDMFPPVMLSQVHLPNLQTMHVRPDENLGDVISNERRCRTPLSEYFRMNSVDGGTGYLYGEFTEHYRWESTQRTWLQRKNQAIMVGRLAFVAPAEGERFYLRLLLVHIRNAQSFASLKTVNGHECATFQEAALELRLVEEDNAIDLCMTEAVEVQMPCALRRLFATTLIFGQPSNPTALWEKNYVHLSADFKHDTPNDLGKVYRLTVSNIERYLEAMGRTLKEFGLDHLTEAIEPELRRTRDIVDALDAPIPEECIRCRGMLNAKQQEAFDRIKSHVEERKAGAFFIDGSGGTGKTFLYNALYAQVRLMNKIVLPTATSGIAASNIPSGRTAHSRFKIPIDTEAALACDVPRQSSLAALIREASLIIWDEASMARKENVESLDKVLRDLCDKDVVFGGKLVVFGGDFHQVLPVLPRKSQKEVVAVSLVNSYLWPHLSKISLTKNIRAREDPEFSKFLLDLGDGKLQQEEKGFMQLPTQIRTPRINGDDLPGLVDLAFPRIKEANALPETFTTRALLTPLNDDVDSINAVLIDAFPGQATVYKSFDTFLDDNCNVYPLEFINKLSPGGMSPHELVFKENCPIILLRNIQPTFGLCNGTRLICKRFSPNLLGCVITTGHHKGEHVFIPRIILRPPNSDEYPFQFQRKQFPVKLSFAMTINNSQGQTLDQVVVYLPTPCFAHGQLYVALSRAKKAVNVTVLLPPSEEEDNDNKVTNLVSYDVLRLAGII